MTNTNLCRDGGIPIFCPKCGKENPDGVVRCEHCFEPLPPPSGQTQQSYTPPTQGGYQAEYQAQGQAGYSQQPYGQNAFNQGGMPPCPKDYLIGNIIFGILGLCGCVGLVTGIIGIVFSAQVKSKYNAGDYAGALAASKTAKIMFIINMILGILSVVGSIIYILVMAVGGGMYWLQDILDYGYYYMAVL